MRRENASDFFHRLPPKEIWKVTIPGRREEHRLFFFLPRSWEIKGRMPRRRQAADNVRKREPSDGYSCNKSRIYRLIQERKSRVFPRNRGLQKSNILTRTAIAIRRWTEKFIAYERSRWRLWKVKSPNCKNIRKFSHLNLELI